MPIHPMPALAAKFPKNGGKSTMKIDNWTVNPKITEDVIVEAVERCRSSLDNPGFCLCCGCEADGVEPDARKYKCEACGAPAVDGAEELLMRIAL